MIQAKKVHRAVTALLLIAMVSACGFHLRGNIPLPENIKHIFLLAPKGSFTNELTDRLEKLGATVTYSRAGSDVVMDVTRVATDRTVGTLDERGKVNSYNVLLKVDYILADLDGVIIREASLQESRRYNFDPELVIESESEEADLLEDMEEAIVLRIIRQLSTVSSGSNEGAANTTQKASDLNKEASEEAQKATQEAKEEQ